MTTQQLADAKATPPQTISAEAREVATKEIARWEDLDATPVEILRGHFVQQLLDAQKAELDGGFYGRLAAKKCIEVRELQKQLTTLRAIAEGLNTGIHFPCKASKAYQQWLTLNSETKQE